MNDENVKELADKDRVSVVRLKDGRVLTGLLETRLVSYLTRANDGTYWVIPLSSAPPGVIRGGFSETIHADDILQVD